MSTPNMQQVSTSKRPRDSSSDEGKTATSNDIQTGDMALVNRLIKMGETFDRVISDLKLLDVKLSHTGLKDRFPLGHYQFEGIVKSNKPKKFIYRDDHGREQNFKSFSSFFMQRTKILEFLMGCIDAPLSWLNSTLSIGLDSQETTSSSSDKDTKHGKTGVFPDGLYPILGVSGIGKSCLIYEIMIRLKKKAPNFKFILMAQGRSALMGMGVMIALTNLASEIIRSFPFFQKECMDLYSALNIEVALEKLAFLCKEIGSYCARHYNYLFLVIDGFENQHHDMAQVIEIIRQEWSFYRKYTRIILVGHASHKLPQYLCYGRKLERHMLCDRDFVMNYYTSTFDLTLSNDQRDSVLDVTGGLIGEIVNLGYIIKEEFDCNIHQGIAVYVDRKKKDIYREQVKFWNDLKPYEAESYWKSIIAMQYNLESQILQCGILDAAYMYIDDDHVQAVTWIAKDTIILVAYELYRRSYHGVLASTAEQIFRYPKYYTSSVVGKFVELLIANHIAQGKVFQVDNIVPLRTRGSTKMLSWSFYGAKEITFNGINPPAKTWDVMLQRLFLIPTSALYPDADSFFYCKDAAATGGFPRGLTAIQITVRTPLNDHSNSFFKVSSRDQKVHASKWKDLFQCSEKDIRMLFIVNEIPQNVSKEWLAFDSSWKSPPEYYGVTFKDIARCNPQLDILNLLYET